MVALYNFNTKSFLCKIGVNLSQVLGREVMALTLQEAGGQILPALKKNCIFGTF